jgi:P27 family predicted phage terminase small subunit
MRGPKPTPRNLRLVKGTDRPDRMNDDEPIVEVAAPEPPDHLNDEEADKFREMAHKLARMRVMSDADVDALAMFVVSWCRMVEADRRVHELGMVTKSPNGFPMQNPYLAIANRARKDCQSILAEFGMTPSSRTRVHAK